MGEMTLAQLTGVRLLSSASKGVSQLILSSAEKRLHKTNERINKLRADDVRKRGKEKEIRKRIKGKKAVGASRAALAAQGIRVDVGSGS